MEATEVGGNDIRYIIKLSKDKIKEKQKDRICIGRIVKIGITNKGKLSLFLYPSKKFTKKELKEIEARAKEMAKSFNWE